MSKTEGLVHSGITEKTPGNILLGAGTIHKGLKFSGGKWNFAESLVGATSGGNSLKIIPELKDIEVDGALVKMKGLTVKQGETASLEVNLIEITPDIIKSALIAQDGNPAADMTGYSVIESKSQIAEGDYWENIAYVGTTISGTPIIAILDNALCTSGLSLDGKNKDGTVGKYTFESSQALTGDSTILPYHIYYPTAG